MTPDLTDALNKLTDGGFEFVVVDDFAAAAYGVKHTTRILTLCAVLTDDSVEVLRRVLADWSPRHRRTPQRLPFLPSLVKGQTPTSLHLDTDVGVIDILTSLLGVGDFTRLKENAEQLTIDGRIYWVISLEDLITAKEAVGREHDLLTVKELRAIAAKRGK